MGRDNINSRHALAPPEDGPDEDASGEVRLLRNPVRNAIHVSVRDLEPGATYDVSIARDGESGSLGMITTVGEDGGDGDGDEDEDDVPGSGMLKLDTKRGDVLPLGSESVADLVGATVSVADSEGTVVLVGEIGEIRRPGGGRGPVIAKFKAAPLEGAQEVPLVETEASGEATFKLKADGSLNFELVVSNIENVTQAHIHIGPAGENGDVVAFLFGFVEGGVSIGEAETLAEGTLTEDDLIPRPDDGFGGTMAELIERMQAGMTYVNVHTLANPAGEIRGQISVHETGRDRRGGGDDEGDEADDGGDGAAAGLAVEGPVELDDDEVTSPSFLLTGSHDASFLRGDVNEDGIVDLSDASRSLMTLFLGLPAPYCLDATDANDDGRFDVSDPVSVLNYLFLGGETPPAPGPSTGPGFDPTPDAFFCHDARMSA